MGHTSPSQLRFSTTKHQPRWIGRPFPLALLLASSVLIGAAPAHATDDIIEAIMGGGTVIGTECVNGKVAELGANEAIPFGPDQTLYVKTSGTTRLRKDAGYTWVNGSGDLNKDKVNFIKLDSDPPKAEGVTHYLVGGTAANEVAEFGTSSGGTASVITGQGTHQMQFVSASGRYEPVVLGTMYTATFNTSDSTYSCIPAGLLPPDKPTNVVAEAHASGGMLVTFEQKGPGGDPTSYTFEAELKGAAGGGVRRGDVVDAEGQADTSSPFLITPTPPFSDEPGEWRIRITAVNAAGEAISDWSNYMTPSVEEPPVPDAPVITGVTTGNGTATVNFTAPNDNGEAITNYAYRLTQEFDNDGDFEPLNPASTASSIPLTDLNNGETYSVSIAAINANGTGPDSNVVEFTPGTQCEDVTSWTAPANTMGYFCSIGLNDYAYADFHVLNTDGTEICEQQEEYDTNRRVFYWLPAGPNIFEEDGKVARGSVNPYPFCHEDTGAQKIWALFDWDGEIKSWYHETPIQYPWLLSVEQFGLNTLTGKRNQIANGVAAFRGLGGVLVSQLNPSTSAI